MLSAILTADRRFNLEAFVMRIAIKVRISDDWIPLESG